MSNKTEQQPTLIKSLSLFNAVKDAYYSLFIFSYNPHSCANSPLEEIKRYVSDLQELLIDIIYFEEFCLFVCKTLKVSIKFDFNVLINQIELLQTRLTRNDYTYKLKGQSKSQIKKERIKESLSLEVLDVFNILKAKKKYFDYNLDNNLIELYLANHECKRELEMFIYELETFNAEISLLISEDNIDQTKCELYVKDKIYEIEPRASNDHKSMSKKNSLPFFYLKTFLDYPYIVYVQFYIIKYKEFSYKIENLNFIDQNFLINRHFLMLNESCDSQINNIVNLWGSYLFLIAQLKPKILELILEYKPIFTEYEIFYKFKLQFLQLQFQKTTKIPNISFECPVFFKYLISFKNNYFKTFFLKIVEVENEIAQLKSHINSLKSQSEVALKVGDEIDSFIVNYQFKCAWQELINKFDYENETDYQKLMVSECYVETVIEKCQEYRRLLCIKKRKFSDRILKGCLIVGGCLSICFLCLIALNG